MEWVFSAEAVTETQAALAESPLWDRDVGLRWLDVPNRTLITRSHEGLETSVLLATIVTALELGPARELLAVTSTGFGWLDPDTGEIDEIAMTITDSTVSMNDGGIDARGRCWAGSAVRDDSQRGALFRLDGGSVATQVDKIGMSNGIDWSPAGDTLYHVDSTAGTVTAWQYDLAKGQLGASRVLCSVPTDVGLPDGLTVDAAGDVWLAVWGAGQIWRLDPVSGDVTARVDVPTPYPTSCAFGGAELTTLYITTANYTSPPGGGLIYAVDLPVRGRNPYRFSGATR